MTDPLQPEAYEFLRIPVELLDNNPWNPNAMDAETFKRLVAEIKEVGFITPVEVVPMSTGRYRILGGEHRVAASRQLGLTDVPAMVLKGARWEDEDLQKLVTVRLNMLRGKTNPEKMAVLYTEMAQKYGKEALKNLFAYTDSDGWDKLVSQIEKGLKGSKLPKEVQQKFKAQAKGAKSLADLERILNELWSSYGDTLDQSYMIFTYGSKEHIYIAMTKDTREQIHRVLAHCKGLGVDVNEQLTPTFRALADLLDKNPPVDLLPKGSESESDDSDIDF